ncbi:hypothetical protein GMST_37820 [Geomonas silvestris]|uniref:Diguanylate cyclase n=1 Tax=Geomonas silvestris TaxID=2740184 RepID=A0A6V8MNL0_9BACT|nr:PAS domain S-box protein [Geomonas silvestris]GFO61457.1 hypothetical protein GMST_37820 [Geomonas silvestris]
MASHRDKDQADNGRHPLQHSPKPWEAERQEASFAKETELLRLVELEMQNAELREARDLAEAPGAPRQAELPAPEQAGSTLRDSEELMYRLADIAVDAIVMLDHTGVVTFCNSACERMFGCDASEVNGSDFHRFFLPERLKEAHQTGFDLFSKDGTGPLIGTLTELPARRTDGSEFALELSVSALMLRGAWHAIGIMRDVTERKKLEAEVQEAREYAENIVETVREPLVVLDSQLRILTANHSFYDTFQVTREETIGNFIYDLGNRQWDIPKLRVLFEEILPKDTVFNGYEVEHDFQEIGRKIILLNARQIFRENIGSHIILLAMEDITERKLAEERISEVIGQQQAILDNIPNIAWLKDRDGRYVAVNQPFSSAFLVPPEEMIGKSDRDIYPPELAEKYERDSREVMAAGRRRYFEEATVDAAGKMRYLEKIETPIFGDKGIVIGIIGIAHDITSRKEVEVTLRHDSTHDILTGLYNRAFFEAELEHLAQGRRLPLCIVMADVNGLKMVNDTRGHEAGDELIRLAARVIQRAFRSDEVVARIGGDEFAILLPGASLEVTKEAVERIRRSPEMTGGKLSIAFGVACAQGKDQVGAALKQSDELMYLDKAAQKPLIDDKCED